MSYLKQTQRPRMPLSEPHPRRRPPFPQRPAQPAPAPPCGNGRSPSHRLRPGEQPVEEPHEPPQPTRAHRQDQVHGVRGAADLPPRHLLPPAAIISRGLHVHDLRWRRRWRHRPRVRLRRLPGRLRRPRPVRVARVVRQRRNTHHGHSLAGGEDQPSVRRPTRHHPADANTRPHPDAMTTITVQPRRRPSHHRPAASDVAVVN